MSLEKLSRREKEELLLLLEEKDRRARGIVPEPPKPPMSLMDYVRAAWHVVEPQTPFVEGWHMEAMAEHLEAATRGQIRNLIINVPPRHAKSLMVSVFWPTWVWTFRAPSRWMFASYALSLSIRDSLKCRNILQSPWYKSQWPALKLSGDQNLKGRFENTAGGVRIATSVAGSVTGEGGDYLVIDDAHNAIEAESDVVRETAIRWYDEAWCTRGNDPKTVVQVVVMQRTHARDLTGHLLEQGGWEHLCLPAEYDESDLVEVSQK